MRILCLLIPHFPESVVRRDEPGLGGRSLIIDREGKVMGCSPEALDQGVMVGMRIESAERLCPEAVVLAADITRYERAFEKVLEVLALLSPIVEAGRLGEAYADISGRTRGSDDEATLCQEVGRKLGQEVGLKGMMGVAGNKFTSYMAAKTIGWGRALLLRPGREREFLARLPVDLLPLNGEMREELRLLGVRSMGQFAQLPRGTVLARFGAQGGEAHQLAQGRDGQPLIPYQVHKVVEATRQFEPPLEMNGMLTQAVEQLVHTCCERLHKQGLSCQEVHLVLSFEDGNSRRAQRTLSGPTADTLVAEDLAQELVRRLSCGDRVTEARLTLGRLQPQEGKQLRLGGISQPAKLDLAQLVRPLAARFGADRFCRGRVLNSSSPIAELRFAWRGWKA